MILSSSPQNNIYGLLQSNIQGTFLVVYVISRASKETSRNSWQDPEMITDEWLIAELNQSVITLQYKGRFLQPFIHSSNPNGGKVKEKKAEIIKFLSSIKNLLRSEGVNALKTAFLSHFPSAVYNVKRREAI